MKRILQKILACKKKIVEDWRDYKLRKGRWFMKDPIFIQVETTNRCNLDCIMCDKESKGRYKKDMSPDDFKRLIENFPRLRLISLHGIGEPLLSEHIFEIIKICKKKSIETVFNTNGMLIDKKVYSLIESGLDRIQISVDGATKKVYEEIRKGANFEQLINNIRLLVKVKSDLHVQHPVLSVHCTVQTRNIRELPRLVELCSTLGIRTITTEGIHNWTKYDCYTEQSVFNEIKSSIDTICKEALLKAEQLGISLCLFPIDRIGETGRLSDYRCDWPWTSCFITVDGYVTPCCVSPNPNILNFGNIFSDQFQKIWNSKEYFSFRISFFQNPRFDICRNCYYLLNYGRKIR